MFRMGERDAVGYKGDFGEGPSRKGVNEERRDRSEGSGWGLCPGLLQRVRERSQVELNLSFIILSN